MPFHRQDAVEAIVGKRQRARIPLAELNEIVVDRQDLLARALKLALIEIEADQLHPREALVERGDRAAKPATRIKDACSRFDFRCSA